MRQIKLEIKTTYSSNIGAGIAMKYLNSEPTPLRNSLGLALSCLFSPIGAAVDGASQSEVEARIKTSRRYFETYMTMALDALTTEQLDFSKHDPSPDHQELNSSAKTNGARKVLTMEDFTIPVASHSSPNPNSEPDLENPSQNSTESVTRSSLSEDEDYINFDEEEF